MNVYSSLPLQGAQRLQTTAMVNGIKLALEQHDGRAGDIDVNYTSLDDSTAAGRQLDAGGDAGERAEGRPG